MAGRAMLCASLCRMMTKATLHSFSMSQRFALRFREGPRNRSAVGRRDLIKRGGDPRAIPPDVL